MKNREIYYNNWALDILFDLIKADMVEKDGEQNGEIDL